MKLLVFDLDGTLVDTKQNITEAVNKTFTCVDFPIIPFEKVISFVGHGSKSLLNKCFLHHNIVNDDVKQNITELFFDYYYDNVTSSTCLFEGVIETLCKLSSHKLVIFTNKPSKMAKKLVTFLKIDQYFLEMIGGDEVEYLKPNPHYLYYFQKKYSAEETIMIGDSLVDVDTAKNANVKSVAVTYGFGLKKDLVTADVVVDSFVELGRVLA